MSLHGDVSISVDSEISDRTDDTAAVIRCYQCELVQFALVAPHYCRWSSGNHVLESDADAVHTNTRGHRCSSDSAAAAVGSHPLRHVVDKYENILYEVVSASTLTKPAY